MRASVRSSAFRRQRLRRRTQPDVGISRCPLLLIKTKRRDAENVSNVDRHVPDLRWCQSDLAYSKASAAPSPSSPVTFAWAQAGGVPWWNQAGILTTRLSAVSHIRSSMPCFTTTKLGRSPMERGSGGLTSERRAVRTPIFRWAGV